jgi:hypothetical protein
MFRGCNNPENINRLPNALNARIPNETLNRLLIGNIDSNCYRCNICLSDDIPETDISKCEITPCVNGACNFVATRGSPTSTAQCNSGWHFTSNCILPRESALVDMTLMYYIRSQTIVLYQMAAVCLGDNCNNITTFKQLKDAVTVDPDLSCLTNDTSSSTTTTTSTISTPSITSNPTTTTPSSSAEDIFINRKLFILIILFSLYI